MIESVDRVSLAKEIEKRCGIANKKMDVLLEVNIGAEEGKSGVLLENLPELVKEITALPHLCLSGLMAIPPAGGNEEENRYYFSKMHHLFPVSYTHLAGRRRFFWLGIFRQRTDEFQMVFIQC